MKLQRCPKLVENTVSTVQASSGHVMSQRTLTRKAVKKMVPKKLKFNVKRWAVGGGGGKVEVIYIYI